jgi:hypothetical protein
MVAGIVRLPVTKPGGRGRPWQDSRGLARIDIRRVAEPPVILHMAEQASVRPMEGKLCSTFNAKN